MTGPYRWYRAIGPRLSLADHGLTFGTSAARGVCLLLREPVPGIDPLGVIRHPGLTLTVADPKDSPPPCAITRACPPPGTRCRPESPSIVADGTWGDFMRSSGSVYSWCGCREPSSGRRLGARCPQRGHEGHGSWYLSLELPAGRDGRRRRIRRGGFPARSRTEAAVAAACRHP